MISTKQIYYNVGRLTYNYVKEQRNCNQHHTVTCTNPIEYTDPSGYLSSDYIKWSQFYKMLRELDRQMRFEREDSWRIMKEQSSGSFSTLMLLMVLSGGGSTGGPMGSSTFAPASIDAPDGGGGGAGNDNPALHFNTIILSDLKALPPLARQLFMETFNSMLKDGYTYLNDRLVSGNFTDNSSLGVLGGVLLTAPGAIYWPLGIFGAFSLYKDFEDSKHSESYDENGFNMGVYIKVRNIDRFGTQCQVTDVYWGTNGSYWFTFNGIFPYNM